MTKPSQLLPSILHSLQRAVLRLTIICVLGVTAVSPAQAQTFQVLHNFTGGVDGLDPYGGLAIDAAGHIYGTTYGPEGCIASCGTVYKISRQGSGWIFSTLYEFPGGVSGARPASNVTVASDGTLYGTTQDGGVIDGCYGLGCGTVYHLQPPATICRSVTCPWTETVLYRFQPCPDLFIPQSGVAFDQAGNIFGEPSFGGFGCQDDNEGDGGIFELTPSQGGWHYDVAYHFRGELTGCNPVGAVVLDQSGNIYGTTNECGLNGRGVIYEVSPSGSGWNESVLYSLGQTQTDGATPFAGLIFDSAGNLYGTTAYGGLNGDGEVFELSPSNGGYTYTVLYNNFSGGTGPLSPVVMDAAGNLYGAQRHGGVNNEGMIFKLTPGSGGWTFTDLHDFSGNDGENLTGNLVPDSSGNLYGTASSGGAYGYGVASEITPNLNWC